MGSDRSERLRAGWISAAAGSGILASKLVAWLLTGSSAVFADAMESVVNVVAAGLLLMSLYVAARPADDDHPYGHGKVEYFSAGIEGTLIAVAAILIAIEATRALVQGSVPRQLDIGLALLVVASIANGALGTYLVRVGRRTHSVALVADGRHVLTDVWTSAGVIVGIGVVWATGLHVLDPIVALGVAGHVLREGFKLAREATHGLMDAADEELLDTLTEALEAEWRPEWVDAHGLRAWRAGADVHADFHLVVPRYFDADRLHRIHDDVEDAVAAHVRGGDVVIHFDPCRPHHCKRCAQPDCPVRKDPFEGRPPFDRDRATRDDGAAGV